jgi:hypothetical protein
VLSMGRPTGVLNVSFWAKIQPTLPGNQITGAMELVGFSGGLNVVADISVLVSRSPSFNLRMDLRHALFRYIGWSQARKDS